eukprot:scaffold358_cov343-Pavlova_lutheri.AAC.32
MHPLLLGAGSSSPPSFPVVSDCSCAYSHVLELVAVHFHERDSDFGHANFDCGCNAKKRRIRPYVGGVCWIDVPTFRMKHEEVLLRDGSFRVDGGPSGSTHDQTSAYESTIWLCDAATSSMANFRAALVAVVDLPSIPFGCGCDRSRRGRTTVPGRPTASKAMFFQKAFHRSNPVGRTP